MVEGGSHAFLVMSSCISGGREPCEGGWLRGEADEDLAEDVVILQRPRRNRRRNAVAAAGGHLAADVARVE